MILTDPFPPQLAEGYTSRIPMEEDVDAVVALFEEDEAHRVHHADPAAHADGSEPEPEPVEREQISSRLVGLRSWTRRQVVICAAGSDRVVAWVACEDRAAGRTNVQWVASHELTDRDDLVGRMLDWAAEVGGSFARHRGLERTQLDATTANDDAERRRLLTEHGYTKVRTWQHMERPVTPEEAHLVPDVREGVRVRRVLQHPSGMPVAQDVRTVHRMLEESFEDHFNSYRESFPEFVQRLAEIREPRWDHWWIAEIQQEDGSWWPGGGLVSAVMPATADAGEGTYLEYLGVHRSARGRGVAKALLTTAIKDAAERGRTRVGLEVDADSPTGADGLYASMGWVTTSRAESWHAYADARPSRLLADEG